MRTEMRGRFICVLVAIYMASFGFAQKTAPQTPSGPVSVGRTSVELDESLKSTFEAKVNTEWEALKQKDKKSYGALLAEDYEGVENDGAGERSAIQAINEVPAGNVYDYTLWGFRVTRLAPGAVFVIYEVTIRFPPTSSVHYSRLYISELWVDRAGEWKELHYQETRVK